MSIESATGRALAKIHRIDATRSDASPSAASLPMLSGVLLSAIAIGFVVLSGGSLDPNDAEAHLGLAAGESFAPFAQVLGGWDPTLAPGAVAISQLWAWLEGGIPSTGAIRWPSALAAVAIGLLMARRLSAAMGPRAGLLGSLTILGCLGMMDRSALFGVDPLAGLAIVGALDRLLSRGADWKSGLWAVASVLLGGWPALATILLCTVVIGRSALNRRLVIPPIMAFLAWSFWAWSSVRAEVWAAAITWPLTRPSAWSLGPWIVVAGLPWAPVGLLLLWRSMREEARPGERSLVTGWLQVAGVGLLAGTLIPGLSTACTVPVLVGLAVAATAGLNRAWQEGLPAGPRRTMLGLTLVLGLLWTALAVYTGAYLAAAQPYYRGVAFVLLILGLATGLMALDSAYAGSTRGAVRVLILVAVGMKVAYAGIYLPETNYRFGKGPWGRAIGQFVPPRTPIYTVVAASPALAFATEHPVRRIPSEVHLKGQPGTGPKFVLLTGPEFEHWPALAPKLLKVREFQDEFGGVRILARTEGKLQRRDED